MEKEQDYIVLLDRFLKGGTSPEEEKDLLDWFRKTAPEETLYSYYRSYWDIYSGRCPGSDVSSDQIADERDGTETKEHTKTSFMVG